MTTADPYLGLDYPVLRERLTERLRDGIGADQAATCATALQVAERVHADETRDEGTPYILHPVRVTLRLLDFVPGATADDVCAALLHDAIESGGTTQVELERLFGEPVAKTVRKLTHDGIEPKSSYLTAFVSAPRRIQRIKLADRLDNVWSLSLAPDLEKIPKYLRETEDYVLSWGRQSDKTMAKAIEDAMAVAAARRS